MSMHSYFRLGEAEWIIHRYRDDDIVLKPGGTASAIMGEIEAVSVRFKPVGGSVICSGGDVTVPTMQALGEFLTERDD